MGWAHFSISCCVFPNYPPVAASVPAREALYVKCTKSKDATLNPHPTSASDTHTRS